MTRAHSISSRGLAPSMNAKLAFTAILQIPLFGSRAAAISCCSEAPTNALEAVPKAFFRRCIRGSARPWIGNGLITVYALELHPYRRGHLASSDRPGGSTQFLVNRPVPVFANAWTSDRSHRRSCVGRYGGSCGPQPWIGDFHSDAGVSRQIDLFVTAVTVAVGFPCDGCRCSPRSLAPLADAGAVKWTYGTIRIRGAGLADGRDVHRVIDDGRLPRFFAQEE
jgi:hypothetical protein